MQKIARVYSRLALLVFNTLIALIVAFLLASRLIPPRNTVQPHVYSSAFRLDSYKIIDRQDAIVAGLDFDAMGEQESYAYNPWTTFQESPFVGALVHVDPGFTSNTRRTTDPARNGQRPLVVWAFGGSTMFGWGMPDEQTIPSHLQRALQQAIPDRQIRVVNYGHAYYTSSEETALFSALLRTENRPDAVIFLDGLNDVLWFGRGLQEPYFAEIARDGWQKERSHNYVELFLLGRQWQPTMHQPADPVRAILTRYRTNRLQRAALARAFGIDAYFFLQPVMFYRAGKVAREGLPDGAAQAYQALEAEPYALIDALADVPNAYIDNAHYSDLASREIARQMAAIMSRHDTIF